MISFFKMLFCKHLYADLICWHWTHGTSGNDPAFVEAKYRCENCGKIVYMYRKGKEAEEWAKVMGSYKKEK